MKNLYKPLIGPDQSLAEITVKGLILGIILAMLLASANAYIGLLVGLTVSASIPASAVSMGVLRFFRSSNILENNMVQTAASGGAALAGGIIFTVPALILMGAWEQYQYWPMVSIAVVGGFLGVAFTIPLRRALIIEARLQFPEGVATSEVLKSGGIQRDRSQKNTISDKTASASFKSLLEASGIGAVFKLFEAGFGWMAGQIATTKVWLGGSYLFAGNITLSPALLGVGYIVGLNIAILIFIGGTIGTLIGVPVNWYFNSETIMLARGIDPTTPFAALSMDQWQAVATESWQNCRRIGVGAMIVGGVWSLISLFKPLVAGVKASMHAYKMSMQDGNGMPRTEFDTPINLVVIGVLVASIPVFFIFLHALADYPDRMMIAGLMTLMMIVFGFLFSSVAGYMAGLVGSSNNPISGVTIATVITSSLILLHIMGNEGIAGTLGPIAVIFLAGMICSAAAIGSDNMQDLKCGHILGSTPWKQQLYLVLGAVSAAFVIPFVLQVLDDGYGIGRPSPLNTAGTFLSAPQAGLMKDLAIGIFGAGIQWSYIYVGYLLAVILIILDEIQKKRGSSFRFPVLAVAIGVYLPLGLAIPIFMGGLLTHIIGKRSARMSEPQQKAREGKGMLLASGLITGEALMGVVIAIVAAFVMQLPETMAYGAVLGITATLAIVVYLFKRTQQDN